jgi:lipopolysaccharide/colanic/teichoic acid biosynthesis glycosyltransferase
MNTIQVRSYLPLKRGLDLCGAVAALMLLSPVIAITALIVAVGLGRPVLFKQPRPGLSERVFTLYKFRTMTNVDVEAGRVSDAQRMTKLGKFIRSTSLDELPSLFNVLRGEMSFVGPRPLLVEYLDRYSPEQARRHQVRPGITGLAQVHGRNNISWEEKFRLDVKYVDELSPLLDAQILTRTVLVVIQQKGVNSRGHVTSPGFTSTEEKGPQT